MHRIITAFSGVLATTIALFLSVAVAEAAPATWVAHTGNNADNCTSPATPCGNFGGGNGALAKTDAGGVIHVLTGDYLSIIINKSVQIVADGGQASNANSVTSGPTVLASFIVNAGAADVVRIRGFVLDRVGSSGGGIGLLTGAALYVENCTIVGSGDNFGIQFAPTGASELYVTNSVISDNGGAAGGGILIKPTGTGSAKVVLDNVRVENNRVDIQVDGISTSGTNLVTVRNSTISGSAAFGFNAIDSGGGAIDVMIEGSTSSNNGTHGVVANGANVTVRMRDSTVSGNDRGLLPVTSGKIISHGGNVVAGNTLNGAFTQSLGQQ